MNMIVVNTMSRINALMVILQFISVGHRKQVIVSSVQTSAI